MSTKHDAARSTTKLDGWRKLGDRVVTLPSGAIVRIRILDLQTHLGLGFTPDGVRIAALGDLTKVADDSSRSSAERDAAQTELAMILRGVVSEMLVEPAVSVDELASVPEQDVAFLLAIAQREATHDAAGEPLGYVRPASVARFRDEPGSDHGSETSGGLAPAVPASVE